MHELTSAEGTANLCEKRDTQKRSSVSLLTQKFSEAGTAEAF